MSKKPRDPLKGYRGERPEQLRKAHERRETEGEPELPEDSPYRKYLLGVQAERLREGLGEAGDAEKVMGEILKRAETDCLMHMKALLANPDLASDAAKIAHFEARVCAGIVGHVNDMIRSALRAAAELEDSDPEV